MEIDLNDSPTLRPFLQCVEIRICGTSPVVLLLECCLRNRIAALRFNTMYRAASFSGTESNSSGSLILGVRSFVGSTKSNLSWAKYDSLRQADMYRVASSSFGIGHSSSIWIGTCLAISWRVHCLGVRVASSLHDEWSVSPVRFNLEELPSVICSNAEHTVQQTEDASHPNLRIQVFTCLCLCILIWEASRCDWVQLRLTDKVATVRWHPHIQFCTVKRCYTVCASWEASQFSTDQIHKVFYSLDQGLYRIVLWAGSTELPAVASWQQCLGYDTTSARMSKLGATPAAQVSGDQIHPSTTREKGTAKAQWPQHSISHPPSSSPQTTNHLTPSLPAPRLQGNFHQACPARPVPPLEKEFQTMCSSSSSDEIMSYPSSEANLSNRLCWHKTRRPRSLLRNRIPATSPTWDAKESSGQSEQRKITSDAKWHVRATLQNSPLQERTASMMRKRTQHEVVHFVLTFLNRGEMAGLLIRRHAFHHADSKTSKTPLASQVASCWWCHPAFVLCMSRCVCQGSWRALQMDCPEVQPCVGSCLDPPFAAQITGKSFPFCLLLLSRTKVPWPSCFLQISHIWPLCAAPCKCTTQFPVRIPRHLGTWPGRWRASPHPRAVAPTLCPQPVY